MCERCCKIRAYIGFAKKSRNIIYGVDEIIKVPKKCELVLISDALALSSKEKLLTTLKKCNVSHYILAASDFALKIESEYIKAIAITDKNLSDAIKKELD